MEKRELKFRAWHKGAEEMLLWDRLKNLRMAIESEDVIVMQYTGLKDKNGVEIYEGDIVKYVIPRQEGIINDIDNEYTELVEFIDGVFTVGETAPINFCSDICEVIGNIYENPDFLKEN